MASHFPQKRPRALDVHRVQGPGASSYRENRDGPLEGTQRRVAPRPSVIGRRFRWDRRRVDPAAWVPARSRAGIQAFSRESPDAKSRGGGPPPPLFYGPLVPTRWFWRLWRIVPVEGLVRCPSAYPDLGRFFGSGCTTQRLPLGGKLSPKVTDEGAILYPTFPCRKRVLSPRRLPSPAPLGESIAPSSAPVCALGHLPPEGKAMGVGTPL